ncbi:MAG TPA: hypothetical protein VFE45_05450 [Coriobacteriia bacterium]|nr:hypothetical protein [Coriobacteriia bacterium]
MELAIAALQDDASRWYDSIPEEKKPATWAAFRTALEARYCSVPAESIRVDKLESFVARAQQMKDKLSLAGLSAYTTHFAQLAGEVPDDRVTLRGKLRLLARGLYSSLAEVVTKEDAKDEPAPLHEVITAVLRKAAAKDHAGTFGRSGSAPPAAAPSSSGHHADSSALALAAVAFGCSEQQAEGYLEPAEGWAEHDTSGAPAPRADSRSAAGASSSPGSGAHADQMERLIAAFTTSMRSGAGHPSSKGAGPQSRRNMPGGVRNEIPRADELVRTRKEAGLCIKCGVAKYEPGGKGHNSRTCQAGADKTTSVVEGKKKANF